MKQVRLWMLAAILAISGASVFTACTAYSDNPVKPVGIAIDEINFPDSAFRNYLLENCDFAEDGILTTEEIKNTTVLDFYEEYNIESLKGIEYFTALEELDCGSNDIVEIDLSNNTRLEELYCSGNGLTKLDVSACQKLELLWCYQN